MREAVGFGLRNNGVDDAKSLNKVAKSYVELCRTWTPGWRSGGMVDWRTGGLWLAGFGALADSLTSSGLLVDFWQTPANWERRWANWCCRGSEDSKGCTHISLAGGWVGIC
eukprot:gene12210-biopygen439